MVFYDSTMALRAVRGATTVDSDTAEQIHSRTQELLTLMLERNEIHHDDLVSILFTATPDIVAAFPAAAARAMGLGDVPLLCAQELAITGSQPLCLRVMMHVESTRRRNELHHVYLEGARGLRDDLPQ